ncbi:RNA-guided endonuclease InsQ/TnpB family protein [Nocardia sp. NPDC055029]
MYVEDLCVKGLARTRLAKSVHDAGWGMFTRMLEEKAARYGRVFGRVDRWFPSSQLCSLCGVSSGVKPLHVRSWTCVCGSTHDRDLNAAINILAAGRADRPTPVELVSDVPSGARPAATGSAAQPVQAGMPTLRGGGDVNTQERLASGSARVRRSSSAGNVRAGPGPVELVSKRTVTTP